MQTIISRKYYQGGHDASIVIPSFWEFGLANFEFRSLRANGQETSNSLHFRISA